MSITVLVTFRLEYNFLYNKSFRLNVSFVYICRNGLHNTHDLYLNIVFKQIQKHSSVKDTHV